MAVINAIMKPPQSSFLSCEKDAQIIIEKLFVKSRPYDEQLKRLLVINTPDCLENTTSEVYKEAVKQASVKYLIDNQYVRLVPKLNFNEHEEVKSYIVITFDDFSPSQNPKFRDCTICFDILCHTDYWDVGNFQLRPQKIMGYIDGILNGSRLTGIGQLHFIGSKMLIFNEHLSGYTLMYRAVHGSDDMIPGANN